MSEVAVTTPTYLIAEFWTKESTVLDDKNRLAIFLEQNGQNKGIEPIIKLFPGQGISGIAVSGDGERLTYHSWPELNYGLATYSAMTQEKAWPFIEAVFECYRPTERGVDRPAKIGHQVARLDVMAQTYSESPANLLIKGVDVAEDLGLNIFAPRIYEHIFGVDAAIGIEESHLLLSLNKLGASADWDELYVDALTCGSNEQIARLPEVLYRRFGGRPVFAKEIVYPNLRQEFPGLTGEREPSQVALVQLGRNRLLLNKVAF